MPLEKSPGRHAGTGAEVGREEVGVLTTLPTSLGMAINRDFTMIHWIGLREKLQVTMGFYHQIEKGLSGEIFPIIQFYE